jgi:hypothetical protein
MVDYGRQESDLPMDANMPPQGMGGQNMGQAMAGGMGGMEFGAMDGAQQEYYQQGMGGGMMGGGMMQQPMMNNESGFPADETFYPPPNDSNANRNW